MKFKAWLLGTAIVLGVAMVVLRVVNTPGAPSEPHRWTEADLPQPVPTVDNGWSALAELPPLEIPDNIDISAALGASTWSELSRRGETILGFDASRALSPQVTAVREALSRPRFVDTCPLNAQANCPWLGVLRSLRVLLIDALYHANQGHQRLAVDTVFRVRRAALDAATHPRSLVGYTAAIALLDESARVALLIHAGDAPKAETPATEAWERLADLEKTLNWELVTGKTAFIAEYLSFWSRWDQLTEKAPRWHWDPSESDDLLVNCLNQVFRSPPGPCRQPPEVSWRTLRNRTGRSVLEVFIATLETNAQSFEKDRRRAIDVSKSLANALSRSAP